MTSSLFIKLVVGAKPILSNWQMRSSVINPSIALRELGLQGKSVYPVVERGFTPSRRCPITW